MRTASLRATAACAGLLLLAGCAGSTDDARASAPSTPPASAVASTVVSETATASPTTEPSKTATPSLVPITTPAATPTPTPTPTPSEAAAAPPVYVKNLPEGAYPGAGGPLPEGAVRTTSLYHEDVLIFKTPSGNIVCSSSFSVSGDTTYLSCYVFSWREERKYRSEDDYYTLAALDLRHYGIEGPRHQGGAFGVPLEDVPVLEYGQVGTTGDYACASMETGLTCWSLLTGNGVLLNRSGYYPFYRDN